MERGGLPSANEISWVSIRPLSVFLVDFVLAEVNRFCMNYTRFQVRRSIYPDEINHSRKLWHYWIPTHCMDGC